MSTRNITRNKKRRASSSLENGIEVKKKKRVEGLESIDEKEQKEEKNTTTNKIREIGLGNKDFRKFLK